METFNIEAVADHQAKGLRTYSFVPIWFGHPVADFGVILADADVALAARIITNTADRLTCLIQLDRPSVVICELLLSAKTF